MLEGEQVPSPSSVSSINVSNRIHLHPYNPFFDSIVFEIMQECVFSINLVLTTFINVETLYPEKYADDGTCIL